MSLKLAVIADDLSGGMNIGVEFSTAGLSVLLTTGEQSVSTTDVLIVDTETRNVESDTAYRRVYECAVNLCDYSPKIMIKKIDSLLRGSIGQEVEALLTGGQFDQCLLVAASPRLDRKTLNGNHFVDGQLLEMVRHQVDPNSIVTGSNIPAILAEQTHLSIDRIDIETIRGGEVALRAALQQTEAAILVADCTTQAELNLVVAAAYAVGIRCFAGTYGLGDAITSLIVPPQPPVLVVVGSLSIAAHYQVQRLMEASACSRVEIIYDEMFLEQPVSEFAKPYRDQLRQAATTYDCVILQLAALAGDVQRIWQSAALVGLDRGAISKRIDDLLAAIVLDNLDRFSGFIATGGTTAHDLYKLLDAGGLRLDAQEVLPGTPGAQIVGGPFAGKPFIAKPGSQGDDDALLRLVQYVRGKS